MKFSCKAEHVLMLLPLGLLCSESNIIKKMSGAIMLWDDVLDSKQASPHFVFQYLFCFVFKTISSSQNRLNTSVKHKNKTKNNNFFAVFPWRGNVQTQETKQIQFILSTFVLNLIKLYTLYKVNPYAGNNTSKCSQFN